MTILPDSAIDTLTPAVTEANSRLAGFGERLSTTGTIDFDSGDVDVNEVALRDSFIEALGSEEGDAWGDDFVNLTRDGFAVLEAPASPGDVPSIVPWRLLSQSPVPALLTPDLLAEFGIGVGGTPTSARAVLTQRFSNVPAEVLDEQTLEWLGQVAFINLGRKMTDALPNILKDFEVLLTHTVKKGGGPTTAPPGTDPVTTALNQAIACINNAEINVHFWGVEVCLDNRCGNLVADFLLLGGFTDIAAALSVVVGAAVPAGNVLGSVANFFGGVVGISMFAIALYSGISIRANITSRGVCLQALWPSSLGYLWWAAGR